MAKYNNNIDVINLIGVELFKLFETKNLNSKTAFTVSFLEGKLSLCFILLGLISIAYILNKLITVGIPSALS